MKTTDMVMEFIDMLKKEGVYNDKVFDYIGLSKTYFSSTMVEDYHITLNKSVMNNVSYRFGDWLDANTEILVCNGVCLVTKDASLYIRIE